MAKLFENNADPDQTPHSATSDLGLHGFIMTARPFNILRHCVDKTTHAFNIIAHCIDKFTHFSDKVTHFQTL